VVVQQCECANATDLCTGKWLRCSVVCYIYFTAIRKRKKEVWLSGRVTPLQARRLSLNASPTKRDREEKKLMRERERERERENE
jgi:hypothetical protein